MKYGIREDDLSLSSRSLCFNQDKQIKTQVVKASVAVSAMIEESIGCCGQTGGRTDQAERAGEALKERWHCS